MRAVAERINQLRAAQSNFNPEGLAMRSASQYVWREPILSGERSSENLIAERIACEHLSRS